MKKSLIISEQERKEILNQHKKLIIEATPSFDNTKYFIYPDKISNNGNYFFDVNTGKLFGKTASNLPQWFDKTNESGVMIQSPDHIKNLDYINKFKSENLNSQILSFFKTPNKSGNLSQKSVQTDNLVKKLQGKILQTEFASLLGPKKDDGIWGKMTSQALSKLIEKYKTGQSTGLNQVVQKDTTPEVKNQTPEVKNQTPEVKVNLGGENLGDLQGFTSSEFTDV